MHPSDLKLEKEKTKQDIREAISGSCGGFLNEHEDSLISFVRICLYKLAQRKPDGRKAANEIVIEMGLEKSFGIKPSTKKG